MALATTLRVVFHLGSVALFRPVGCRHCWPLGTAVPGNRQERLELVTRFKAVSRMTALARLHLSSQSWEPTTHQRGAHGSNSTATSKHTTATAPFVLVSGSLAGYQSLHSVPTATSVSVRCDPLLPLRSSSLLITTPNPAPSHVHVSCIVPALHTAPACALGSIAT